MPSSPAAASGAPVCTESSCVHAVMGKAAREEGGCVMPAMLAVDARVSNSCVAAGCIREEFSLRCNLPIRDGASFGESPFVIL